jgi:lysophospholipase L1-like esterase
MAVVFYISLIVGAAGLLLLIRLARLNSIPGLAMGGRTLLLFSVLLPGADYVLQRSHREIAPPAPAVPVYSFKSAKGDPDAFKAWWAYYAAEWGRPNGGASSIQMADPEGVLPFIHKPNSVAAFFDATIRINNLGFRGPDIEFYKGDRYRVFALGESPTFGATIRRDDRAWPEVLGELVQSRLQCARPIEVINAGTGGYHLQHNIESLRRNIIPLKPDLVLSYHGSNGARFVELGADTSEPASAPQRTGGPSALINEAIYRYRLYRWRKTPAAVASFSEESILQSSYAELYRQLIRLGRANNFQVVLSTFSMAVTQSSPREVMDFYSMTFSGDGLAARMAAHNRIVEKIAAEQHVPFIDTTPNLDGKWDDDLFLDPIHLTQKGSEILANTMFAGLVPIFRGDATLRCAQTLRNSANPADR